MNLLKMKMRCKRMPVFPNGLRNDDDDDDDDDDDSSYYPRP